MLTAKAKTASWSIRSTSCKVSGSHKITYSIFARGSLPISAWTASTIAFPLFSPCRARDAATLHFELSLVTLGVDLVNRRMKQDIDPLFLEKLSIALEIPRIGSKIFLRSKLGGIDKDRNHDLIAAFPGVAYEAQMSFMEKPHGRNENQTPSLAALRLTPIFHLVYALDDLHGHRIRRGDRPVALI